MSEAAELPNSAIPPDVANDPEYRALAAEWRLLEQNIIMARAAWARQVGITFGDKRNTYEIFGYKDILTTSDYRARYQRGGLAARIVDAMPNATWRGSMEIIEDDTKEEYTEFEQAWADLDKRLQVQAKFLRVDKLAGLSSFAVLLIGAAGDFETPLPRSSSPRPNQVLYLTPFLGGGGPGGSPTDRAMSTTADASIKEYEVDPQNARFGLPKSYTLKRTDLANAFPRPVHWSRIIHIAEGLLDDEVFGLPSLERVWNLLDDLDKVTGGGAEAFWLRANQGLHVNIDKDMTLPDTKDTVAALKEQMEAYKHGLDRWLRTRGVDVKTLGSDVANFSNPADAILTQIAGAKSIPKRILTGSEMGELASSQDRDNWKDQINGRQTQYAGPYIVRPLVDRLIAYGYLPTPKKGADSYEVRWPHIQTLTEQEKADGALKWSQTKQGEDPIFTDAEIRDKWYGMAPLTDEQRQEIADRKMEAIQRQQEAMQQPQDEPGPNANRGRVLPFKPRAAEESIINQLTAAITAGEIDVVHEIIGLGDVAGHPFHGNQYTDGEGGGDPKEHVKRSKKATEEADKASEHANMRGEFSNEERSKRQMEAALAHRKAAEAHVAAAKAVKSPTAKNYHNTMAAGHHSWADAHGKSSTIYATIDNGIIGLGDLPGHPFHGNQYVDGNSSGRTDQELQESVKDKPKGTVVVKSKYGQVEIEHQIGAGGTVVRFRGRRKNGEAVPSRKTLREAKEELRKPRNTDSFVSGYLSPDVVWKEPKS